MTDDEIKAHIDAALYGVGFMQGGKHVPLDDVYLSCDEDPPCTDCDDTGVSKQTERYCTCDVGMERRAIERNWKGTSMTEVEGMIRIGGFLIEQPYGDGEGKLAIYRYQDGEGGDFDAAELEALIAKFYEERF